MSLLMFRHETDAFVILTDTLATTPEGDPFLYQCKCWPLPQLNMVLSGTGLAPFIEAWYRCLQTSILARDIEMLDAHAPKALRKLWTELEAELGPLPGTATVYHFGVREKDGRLTRYVYRSDRKFESEIWSDPGFGVKPPPSGLQTEVPDSIDEMIKMARQIRSEQDQLPISERVHIGGDLIITVLQNGIITSTKIFRFEDYDEAWLAMNERLSGSLMKTVDDQRMIEPIGYQMLREVTEPGTTDSTVENDH